jgi:tetratricopeptide (TPR) repeat protein
MASSDLPPTPPEGADAPTGIQTPPETPAAPPIPLPPLPQAPAMSAEKLTRIRGGLDGILVALVLVFAFLVASFPVTNPDFFRQLATGRLLAHGEYHFGVDPFTYTTESERWVDHSWLFALLLYGLYQIPSIGSIAVVVAKALLVVGLAEIMLRTGRRVGQSLWVPAACTALALLTLSPRLYLQPVCLSFLFLGLTLWLLTAIRYPRSAIRPDSGQRTADSGSRMWWWIPPLFALWVNCDAWFFVGPLAVALYLIGELLQHWYPPAGTERDEAGRRRVGTLALVLVVGLAACLVNPHHVHVFTLPPELGLSPASDLIAHDAQFRTLFLSPLRRAYYDPLLGLSVAGLAYWPLLLAGAVSFGFVFGRVPGWRLPVWLGFALLSLYNVRAIPFFAIVAGPITALNWLDYAVLRLGCDPLLTLGWRRWSIGGRALTILLALALLVAVVPGWLQSRPYEAHRIGWDVRVDPSLEEAARQIKSWRDAGQLPADARWFNLHQEIANYLAWFAPGERAFFDQRIPQFRDTATDYLRIREGLEQMVPDRDAPAAGVETNKSSAVRVDWPGILRRHGVQFWIIDQLGMQKADQVAPYVLFVNPQQWKLCYLRGRIAIFAWKDPEAKSTPSPSPAPLDLERVAFGPEAEQAPPAGPETVPPPPRWWEVWWRRRPPTPLDEETAKLHAIRFEAMQPQVAFTLSRAWQTAVAAGSVGNALPQGPLPNCLLALNVSWSQTYADLFPLDGQPPARPPDRQRDRDAMYARQVYVRGQDVGPPESLYLGVRAARRALAVNPADADAYVQLGWTYARLREATREALLMQASPLLADIRRTQMVAAYQDCLRCQPHPRNAAKAHEALYGAFQQHYYDLAAHHLRELRSTLQAIGPAPDQAPEKFAQTLEAISKRLMPLEEEVKRRQDQYEVSAANKPMLEKVRIALEKGLAETALTTLEQAAPGELSSLKEVSIVSQMMALLLDMGRLDQARDLLLPEPDMVGKPVPLHYLDYHVRLAAARGDYAEADRHLADALKQMRQPTAGRPSSSSSAQQIGERVARVLLAEAQRLGGAPRVPTLVQVLPSDFWVRRWRLDALETGLLEGQQRADWYLLRGCLALEAGRCVEAREHFQLVLATVVPPDRWVPEVNHLDALLDPREMQILQHLPVRQGTAEELSRHYLKWLDAARR